MQRKEPVQARAPVVIRPSQRSDAHSMFGVYVQTWRDTYLSVIPYGYLYEMSDPRYERAFCSELNDNRTSGFVAEHAGRIVGFVTGGPERNGDAVYGGEIYTLYVLKSFQRRGIGRRLVAALAAQFHRSGMHSMLVRVLKSNPYRMFYRRINGTFLKSERLLFNGEVMETEIYGWPDATLIDE